MSPASRLLAPLTSLQVRDIHQRIAAARTAQADARQVEDAEGEQAATLALDQLLDILARR